MIEVKMYPAQDGDAFLLKPQLHRGAVLVDGGYASTFDRFISPDLKELAASGFHLDLVVATHIDADHISGLLQLFRQNQDSEEPKVIAIKEVWHNSLRGLMTRKREPISSPDLDLLHAIEERGFPLPRGSHAPPSEISARQGSSLAKLLAEGGYRWNGGDGSTRIERSSSPRAESVRPSVSILAPTAPRLDGLRDWWISKLRRFGFSGRISDSHLFDDAYEFLVAGETGPSELESSTIAHSTKPDRELEEAHTPDVSVTNASSIVLLVHMEGQRLLFLGDSRPDDVEAALREEKTSAPVQLFDAIKVSHHGSLYNTSPSLLRLIDAPDFLISTDGTKHDLPDLEVLKAIVDRPANFCRRLFFNYKTTASEKIKTYKSKAGAAFAVYENGNTWIQIGSPHA